VARSGQRFKADVGGAVSSTLNPRAHHVTATDRRWQLAVIVAQRSSSSLRASSLSSSSLLLLLLLLPTATYT
jgi:hypothetical protein